MIVVAEVASSQPYIDCLAALIEMTPWQNRSFVDWHEWHREDDSCKSKLLNIVLQVDRSKLYVGACDLFSLGAMKPSKRSFFAFSGPSSSGSRADALRFSESGMLGVETLKT